MDSTSRLTFNSQFGLFTAVHRTVRLHLNLRHQVRGNVTVFLRSHGLGLGFLVLVCGNDLGCHNESLAETQIDGKEERRVRFSLEPSGAVCGAV